MSRSLTEFAALIIDMDGVLWHGQMPLPGLLEFFNTLRVRRLPFVLATNNASQTPEQFQEKLRSMGVETVREEILTSSQATALYLKSIAPGARVFVIGEDGLKQALSEAGLLLANEDVDYVVCGMDRTLSWEKIAQATLNIRAGAHFIGTNPDKTFPTERGLVHGNGAILAALEASTDVKPIIVGKPEPIMYQQAMIRLCVEPALTIAVGDRLETDILGAKRAGIASVLILTGVTTPAQLNESDYQPEWVFETLQDFTAALQI
ncbi:MAG: TIGR01457 family HAD-type hydrolase [Acidobacteriota bacterium]